MCSTRRPSGSAPTQRRFRTPPSSNGRGCPRPIESLPRPDHLFRLRDKLGEQLIFSLDLKNGRPLADPRAWGTENAWDVARHAAEMGIRQVIVLDLAQVGTFAGVGTDALIAERRADEYGSSR